MVALATGAAAQQVPEPAIELRISARDTLIGLSERVFNGPAAWQEIARLNRVRDPNRILPGQVLRVPTRLMRNNPLPATLVNAVGEVRVDNAPAAAGTPMAEGQRVETGPNGSAVIGLADGSRVRVPPSSLAEVLASRTYGAAADATAAANSGAFAGALRLVRGSVEVLASKVRRAQPLEVTTPTAVIGVRGTQYRVSLDDRSTTRSEVLEGQVRLDAASRAVGSDLNAGFGAAIDARALKPVPTALLPAPDLSAVPARFERALVRLALPGETVPLRVQVAADAAFEQVVSDQRVLPGSDVRIAGLADANWHLRARRIDPQGLEGYDAALAFVLKARPEPPASNTPRPGAKQTVGAVEFAWSPNLEARSARLQVARDAGFQQLVLERDGLTNNRDRFEIAEPGLYFWRLGSVRADGDRGPFGEPQRFELRALPEPPQGGLAGDGKSLRLAWGGRPDDLQEVELARDPQFMQIVARAQLKQPQWTLPAPETPGTYYFRYRSIEPDGFVTPYSSTLTIEVPRDWRWLWLLAPLLFAL
jgi:hypothetical protein